MIYQTPHAAVQHHSPIKKYSPLSISFNLQGICDSFGQQSKNEVLLWPFLKYLCNQLGSFHILPSWKPANMWQSWGYWCYEKFRSCGEVEDEVSCWRGQGVRPWCQTFSAEVILKVKYPALAFQQTPYELRQITGQDQPNSWSMKLWIR